MKRMQWALVLTLALGASGGVGLVTGLDRARTVTAQEVPVKRQVLEKVDLGDKEGTMYVAEIAPGASTGLHFHPGPEAVYVLHGTGTLEKEGHPPATFTAGQGFSIPPNHTHEAKNGSTSEPWKLLVFLAGERGQPIATAVTPPYFWKK